MESFLGLHFTCYFLCVWSKWPTLVVPASWKVPHFKIIVRQRDRKECWECIYISEAEQLLVNDSFSSFKCLTS